MLPTTLDRFPLIQRLVSRPLTASFEVVFSKKPPTLPTILQRALMALIVVEMTGAIVFMLKLAIPTPSKGQAGGIATNPLLTTARFDQRHPLTATEPTMLARHRFGFHAVVSQRLSSIRSHSVMQVDFPPSPSLYCRASAFKSQDDRHGSRPRMQAKDSDDHECRL